MPPLSMNLMPGCCCFSLGRQDQGTPLTDEPQLTSISNRACLQDRHRHQPHGCRDTFQLIRPASARERATQRPPDEPADLDQLVVDDSEGDDYQHRLSKRASGALDAVRSKIVRHISHESSLKRQANAAVGNSEEEVARRAELKRLMHKRIQDELRSEEVQDTSSNKSVRSKRHLSSPIDFTQPGGGPRDTIEFAFLDDSLVPVVGISHNPDAGSGSVELGDPKGSGNAAIDCPPLVDDANGGLSRSGESESNNDLPVDQPSSQQCVPGCLRPQSVPGSVSQNSFQLSNNATPLDHVLSTNKDISGRHGSNSGDGHSALGVWLIAQGLRSRDNSLVKLGGAEKDTSAVCNKSALDLHDLDGNSRVGEATTPELALAFEPPTSTKENEQLDTLEAISANPIDTAMTLEKTPATSIVDGEQDYQSSTSSPRCLNSKAASCADTLKDNRSSKYASPSSSVQASPARSRSNIHTLSVRDLQSLQLAPFQWHFGPYISNGVEVPEPARPSADWDKSSSRKIPAGIESGIGRQSILPLSYAASVAPSEALSLQQREAELRTIEKRFGQVLSRKKPSSPISSRFREEFAENSNSNTSKRPLLSKLYSSVQRRSKHGSSSTEGTRSESGRRLPLDIAAQSKAGEKGLTGDLRQVLNAERSFSPRRSKGLSNRDAKTTKAGKPLHPVNDDEHNATMDFSSQSVFPEEPSSLPTRYCNLVAKWDSANQQEFPKLGAQRERSRLTPESDELQAYERNSVPVFLQRWKSSIGLNALEDNAIVVHGQMSKNQGPGMPPESWARFPSHIKEQRLERRNLDSADLKSKDPAMLHRSSSGNISWITNGAPVQGIDVSESRTSSVPINFRKTVRRRLTKIFMVKSFKDSVIDDPLPNVTSGANEHHMLETDGLRDDGNTRALEALEENYSKLMNTPLLIAATGGENNGMLPPDPNSDAMTDRFSRPRTPAADLLENQREGTTTPEIFVTPVSHRVFGDFGSQPIGLSGLKLTQSDSALMVSHSSGRPISRPRSSSWAKELDMSLVSPNHGLSLSRCPAELTANEVFTPVTRAG